MTDAIPDAIRSATETAERTLVLFAIVALGLGADRSELDAWLTDSDRWDKLAPSERALLQSAAPSQKQLIDAGWQSERLVILAWALGLVDQVPPADQQCDPALFQTILPPFTAEPVAAFIARARLRPPAALMAMADALLTLHWQARDARLHRREPIEPIDIEVVQERHHAINWVTGYDGADWDEVTTDT